MKITAIRLQRLRLPLDPPFDAAWDPVARRQFDATIVRGLLVPATMQLMGRANWWLPGPLQRAYDRFGVRESSYVDGRPVPSVPPQGTRSSPAAV